MTEATEKESEGEYTDVDSQGDTVHEKLQAEKDAAPSGEYTDSELDTDEDRANRHD
jgi:hypothetical protein